MTARQCKAYDAQLAGKVKQWRLEREHQTQEAALQREALEREIQIRHYELEIRQAREYYRLRATFGFQLGPGVLATLEGARHGHA